IVQDQRDARYNLLRGYFHGADDDSADDHGAERLATVSLPQGSRAAGRQIGEFALHAMGVRVVSLRHIDGRVGSFDDEIALKGGDTLVLSGRTEPLALAEEKLLKG
ncbi:MAG TPA: TrkA C-terminal domain-containing protein, partial [Ramlibacter sp.]|nr:TrkA C-terminal domain-containing protein [Ramlibacter sp.]